MSSTSWQCYDLWFLPLFVLSPLTVVINVRGWTLSSWTPVMFLCCLLDFVVWTSCKTSTSTSFSKTLMLQNCCSQDQLVREHNAKYNPRGVKRGEPSTGDNSEGSEEGPDKKRLCIEKTMSLSDESLMEDKPHGLTDPFFSMNSHVWSNALWISSLLFSETCGSESSQGDVDMRHLQDVFRQERRCPMDWSWKTRSSSGNPFVDWAFRIRVWWLCPWHWILDTFDLIILNHLLSC